MTQFKQQKVIILVTNREEKFQGGKKLEGNDGKSYNIEDESRKETEKLMQHQ